MDRAASDLEKARSESSHLTQQIKDNRRKYAETLRNSQSHYCSLSLSHALTHLLCVTHRLDMVQRQRELMQEELKRSTQKVLSAEERAQEIDSRLTEEEEHLQQLEKEIAKLREKQVGLCPLTIL